MGNIIDKRAVLDRIKEYYDLKGNADLARFLGLAPNTISNWYGRNSFDIDVIYTKCEGLDMNWLLTGKKILPYEQEDAQIAISEPQLNITHAHKGNLLRIPIVDISIAAGDGAFNKDYLEEVEAIELPMTMVHGGNKYLGVKVKGLSMEPTFQRDSYLIIRYLPPSEWENIKDGHVYVISDREGLSVVKRVKNRLKEKGFIVCTSDNPDKNSYGNFNIGFEELNTVWYVEWNFRSRLNNIHDTYYYKQTELEDKIENIDHQLEMIKRTLNIPNTH